MRAWLLATFVGLAACAGEDTFAIRSELAPTFRVAAIRADPYGVPEGYTTAFDVLTVGTDAPEAVAYRWELCAYTDGPNGGFACATRDDGQSARLAEGTGAWTCWRRDLTDDDVRALCMDHDRYSRDPLAPPVDCDEGLPAVLRVEATYRGQTAVGVKTVVLTFGDDLREVNRLEELRVGYQTLPFAPGVFFDMDLDDDEDTLPLPALNDSWALHASRGVVADDTLLLPPLVCGEQVALHVVHHPDESLDFNTIRFRYMGPDCDEVVERGCELQSERDSDGDGRLGCEDPDCEGHAGCSELRCDDGVDNDNNGLTDCLDPACVGRATCYEDACTDLFDGDGDGLTDCDDPDCLSDPACVHPTETDRRCFDGIDNDGDGELDCADTDCTSASPCAHLEWQDLCGDGMDNDGDGRIDCDDPSCGDAPWCAGASCGDRILDDGELAWVPTAYDVDAVPRPLCLIYEGAPISGYHAETILGAHCPASHARSPSLRQREGGTGLPLDCLEGPCDGVPVRCAAAISSFTCRGTAEECDDGGRNGAPSSICTAACLVGECGDGIVSYGEACDDGNDDDTDHCDRECRQTACGDGILDDGEACDDGNAEPDDGCFACRVEGCGDGVVTPSRGEECDGGALCTEECLRPDSCVVALYTANSHRMDLSSEVALGDDRITVTSLAYLSTASTAWFAYPMLVVAGHPSSGIGRQTVWDETVAALVNYVDSGGVVLFTQVGVPWFLRDQEVIPIDVAAADTTDEEGTGPLEATIVSASAMNDGPYGVLPIRHTYVPPTARTARVGDAHLTPISVYHDGSVHIGQIELHSDLGGAAYVWAEDLFAESVEDDEASWTLFRNLIADACDPFEGAP